MKNKFCFNCGWVIVSRDYDRYPTCGQIECERVANEAAKDDRLEEARDREYDRDWY